METPPSSPPPSPDAAVAVAATAAVWMEMESNPPLSPTAPAATATATATATAATAISTVSTNNTAAILPPAASVTSGTLQAPSTPLQNTHPSRCFTSSSSLTAATSGSDNDAILTTPARWNAHNPSACSELTPVIRNVSYISSPRRKHPLHSSSSFHENNHASRTRGNSDERPVLRQRSLLPLPRGSGSAAGAAGGSARSDIRGPRGTHQGGTTTSTSSLTTTSTGLPKFFPATTPKFPTVGENHGDGSVGGSVGGRRREEEEDGVEEFPAPPDAPSPPRLLESGRTNGGSSGGVNHKKRCKEDDDDEEEDGTSFLLAPIELKPDRGGRKFFSFSGSSQYRSQVGLSATGTGGWNTTTNNNQRGWGGGHPQQHPMTLLATIDSPRRFTSVGNGKHLAVGENSPITTMSSSSPPPPPPSTPSPKQYEPFARSQHGVKEMADTKDLDAIFKSPRSTTASASNFGAGNGMASAATSSPHPPMVVTPAAKQGPTSSSSSSFPTTTMITNLPPNQDPDEEFFLHQSFPLDDRQYSIPSIRLANHINRSLTGDSVSLHSYEQNYSRTFSEDESTWEGSLYDDDCDTEASWSTSGGGGGGGGDGSLSSWRRKQFMRHRSSSNEVDTGSNSLEGLRHLNSIEDERQTCRSLEGLQHLNRSGGGGGEEGEGGGGGEQRSNDNSSSSIPNRHPPALAPSNSFMERMMQGITINQRSNTFESSSDAESYQSNFNSNNPALMINTSFMINATQSMDDAEYETRQDHRMRRNYRSHRSGRRSRRSSHARTSSAVEWIQGLQNPMNGGGIQIVEAASSKFLTGGVVSSVVGGNVDGAEGVVTAALAASEDVTKALGMPHPLCRSSTIEAGPFVNRAAAAAAATNGFNGEY